MNVSVALCTFNGAAWLGPFLAGLAAQTRLPDELVVSDDGSDDDTLAIIDTFAGESPFPVRVSATVHRLGSTRNFALVFGQCHGDLIAPADQDDIWAPAKLQRLTDEIEARHAAMVFSDGRIIDAAGDATGQTLWAGVGFGGQDQRRFDRAPLSVLLRRSVVTGATMLFRAELLDLVTPFPASLGSPANPMLQDRWISILIASVAPVGRVAEPLVDFRVHPGQQTGLRPPHSRRVLAGQLARPRADSVEELEARAAQLTDARDRIGGRPCLPGATEELTRAIAHLGARAGLGAARWRRTAGIAAELASGRYRRYSTGIRSAVADLARPA